MCPAGLGRCGPSRRPAGTSDPGRAERGTGRAATLPSSLLPVPDAGFDRCSPRLGRAAAVREERRRWHLGLQLRHRRSRRVPPAPAPSAAPAGPLPRRPIRAQNPPRLPAPTQSTRGGERPARPIRARPGETNRQRARRGFKNAVGRAARRRSAAMRRRCHGSGGAAAGPGRAGPCHAGKGCGWTNNKPTYPVPLERRAGLGFPQPGPSVPAEPPAPCPRARPAPPGTRKHFPSAGAARRRRCHSHSPGHSPGLCPAAPCPPFGRPTAAAPPPLSCCCNAAASFSS